MRILKIGIVKRLVELCVDGRNTEALFFFGRTISFVDFFVRPKDPDRAGETAIAKTLVGKPDPHYLPTVNYTFILRSSYGHRPSRSRNLRFNALEITMELWKHLVGEIVAVYTE
jgi:hypothetical protein